MAAYSPVEGAVYVFRAAAGGHCGTDGGDSCLEEDGDQRQITRVGEGGGELRGCTCVVLLHGAVSDG